MENLSKIYDKTLRDTLKHSTRYPRVVATKLEYSEKGINYFSDIIVSGDRVKKIELWCYSPFQKVRKHTITKVKAKDVTGEYYAELCDTIDHVLNDTTSYIISTRDF